MKIVFLVIALFVIVSAEKESSVENTTGSSDKHSGNLDWKIEGSHSHYNSNRLEALHRRLHDRLGEHGSSDTGNYQRQSSRKFNANLNADSNRKSQLHHEKQQHKNKNNNEENDDIREDPNAKDENLYKY